MLHDQWRIPLPVNTKLLLLTRGWFLAIELKQHHSVEPNQDTPTWGILCAILWSYLKNDIREPQRPMGRHSKSKVIICIILGKTIDILEFFIQTPERMIRSTIKTHKIMKIKIEWPQNYLLNLWFYHLKTLGKKQAWRIPYLVIIWLKMQRDHRRIGIS